MPCDNRLKFWLVFAEGHWATGTTMNEAAVSWCEKYRQGKREPLTNSTRWFRCTRDTHVDEKGKVQVPIGDPKPIEIISNK